MSASPSTSSSGVHGEAPHHGAPHGHQAGHGSLKGYLIGFVMSVILTAIPFWLVMNHVIADATTAALIILILAAVQIVVHVIYFLHLNTKSEGGWNMLATIFTVVIVGIAVSGSFWVMFHLNTNMMPMTPEQMRNMP